MGFGPSKRDAYLLLIDHIDVGPAEGEKFRRAEESVVPEEHCGEQGKVASDDCSSAYIELRKSTVSGALALAGRTSLYFSILISFRHRCSSCSDSQGSPSSLEKFHSADFTWSRFLVEPSFLSLYQIRNPVRVECVAGNAAMLCWSHQFKYQLPYRAIALVRLLVRKCVFNVDSSFNSLPIEGRSKVRKSVCEGVVFAWHPDGDDGCVDFVACGEDVFDDGEAFVFSCQAFVDGVAGRHAIRYPD